jgi:hypothetical protein
MRVKEIGLYFLFIEDIKKPNEALEWIGLDISSPERFSSDALMLSLSIRHGSQTSEKYLKWQYIVSRISFISGKTEKHKEIFCKFLEWLKKSNKKMK